MLENTIISENQVLRFLCSIRNLNNTKTSFFEVVATFYHICSQIQVIFFVQVQQDIHIEGQYQLRGINGTTIFIKVACSSSARDLYQCRVVHTSFVHALQPWV